jgi:hypothetical protein
VCIDERSKDFSKKDENCGDEVAIIKTDEEVAERQPNQTLICLTIRHLNRWSLTNKKTTRNGQIVAETQHLYLKNSTGYGEFPRNPALLRQSLTLAEIGGCSLTQVKQCWSLKQEIERTKSGLPSFAHFR